MDKFYYYFALSINQQMCSKPELLTDKVIYPPEFSILSSAICIPYTSKFSPQLAQLIQ